MNYGIMNAYLPQDTNAALLRNLCEPGIEALEEEFPTQPSDYYFDMCVQYDGGGRLSFTRVYVENRNDEGISVSIESLGSPPAGAIGDTVWFPPNSLSTGHAAIPMKSITMSQRIEEGQVVWGLNSYQIDSWSTSPYSGFYNKDYQNADITIFYATVPVTFNYGEVWVFQTWRDTPLLQNSPSQAFLDSLHKESDYYLTYYLVDNNGSAQGAQRLYFKIDPGTIYFRTSYQQGAGSNGWFVQWDNATDSTGAWSYTLDNSGADPDDWTLDSDSGDWALPVAEYTENNPRLGFNCQEPYWLFIIESTVPIRYAGHNIQPGPGPDPYTEYFFNKDEGFTMVFGAGVQPESAVHEPDFNDINRYYLTKKYRPTIRFVSPVDSETYTVNPNLFTSYEKWTPKYDINTTTMPYTIDGYQQMTTVPKNSPINSDFYLIGCRNFDNTRDSNNGNYVPGWDMGDTENITYNDMKPHNSVQAFTLGHLVEWGKTVNPTFSGEDVFTEIFMDFYDMNDNLIGTKSVDFSSLQGSGVDPTTDDGMGNGEGTSWNPMPTADNEGQSSSDYNGDETDRVPLNQPKITPYGKFHKTYLLNATQVTQLADELSTTDDSAIEAILDGLQMWGANPIDAIVDLRMYPFDVAAKTEAALVYKTIMLGRHDTGISARVMSDTPVCVLYLGGIKVPTCYNNFLDYEPYTTIRLYIPYVGTVDLPPSLYVGHMVSVNLVVDFYTGACTAVIYCDGLPMTYQEGIIGTSIAISGDNASAYANGIVGNIVGAVGSAAGAVAAGITGHPTLAVHQGAKSLEQLFDMGQSINDVQFQQAGSTSPAMGMWLPQKCHLMIARPQTTIDNQYEMTMYGENIGYATAYCSTINNLANNGIYYATLSRHSGVSATEPTPTEKEVDMIKQALNNGFYKS